MYKWLISYDIKVILFWYYLKNHDITNNWTSVQLFKCSIDDASAASSLKYITLLSSHIKKIPKNDVGILIASLKVLIGMRNPKTLEKLEKEDRKINSVLFCPIDEYLDEVRRFQDQRDMNQRFRYAMME